MTKILSLITLAKQAQVYGIGFRYAATIESGNLTHYPHAKDSVTDAIKTLDIMGLVAELGEELNKLYGVNLKLLTKIPDKLTDEQMEAGARRLAHLHWYENRSKMRIKDPEDYVSEYWRKFLFSFQESLNAARSI